MGFPVTIQTQFGTLFAGLRTPSSARRQHARVGTGRNMPGTPGKCLSTLDYATSCRTFENCINGVALMTGCEAQRTMYRIGFEW
jgi:hypothetical protein